jgi:hypothetical protein
MVFSGPDPFKSVTICCRTGDTIWELNVERWRTGDEVFEFCQWAEQAEFPPALFHRIPPEGGGHSISQASAQRPAQWEMCRFVSCQMAT